MSEITVTAPPTHVEHDHKTSGMQAALYGALAIAQGEFKPIAKNRTVRITSTKGNYTFRYADLETIMTATRPALAKNGLALVQTLESLPNGGTLLVTQLVHKDGGRIVSEVKLPGASDSDPKAFGGIVTYYRRYAACPMLGVAADDDLDENGEGGDGEAEAERILLKNARAEAQRGVENYVQFWTKTLSAQQRVALASHHPGLKKIAEGVDKANAKVEKAPAQNASGGADPAQG